MVNLGLDLSLRQTGFVVLKDGKFFSSGVLTTKETGVKRLDYIQNEIEELIRRFNFGEILISIENYAFGARGNAMFSVGELGGVVKLLLFKRKIPFIKIAPTAVKKFVTGKGNSKKEKLILEVYKKYNLEFRTNDEADAFILAKIGWELVCFNHHNEKLNPHLTNYQQEVIKKIIESNNVSIK